MFFIFGPCALESMEQIRPLVALAHRWNIQYFRAQLFKPRTHPDSFQGLERRGLPLINYLKSQKLKLVAEACSLEQLYLVKEYADILQIGARNMQNFELLKKIGQVVNFTEKGPHVLLKRGFSNTPSEWLASADYLLASGVPAANIILCERGTRNHVAPGGVTLDLALALDMKATTPYKVIVDPSHGCRVASLVLPLARACMATNLDGLMVEVHPRPRESLSDAQQAVGPRDFEQFLATVDLEKFGIFTSKEMEQRNLAAVTPILNQ